MTAQVSWCCRTTSDCAGVWQTAGELGIPVWWHIADPVAFFDPVDEHNEFLELLARASGLVVRRPGVPDASSG